MPQDLASEGGGEEEEDVTLGDVVEEELAATSQAVEEAARRIQVRKSLPASLLPWLFLSPIHLPIYPYTRMYM